MFLFLQNWQNLQLRANLEKLLENFLSVHFIGYLIFSYTASEQDISSCTAKESSPYVQLT